MAGCIDRGTIVSQVLDDGETFQRLLEVKTSVPLLCRIETHATIATTNDYYMQDGIFTVVSVVSKNVFSQPMLQQYCISVELT